MKLHVGSKVVEDLQINIQYTTFHAGSIGTGVCDYLACWVRTGWGTE